VCPLWDFRDFGIPRLSKLDLAAMTSGLAHKKIGVPERDPCCRLGSLKPCFRLTRRQYRIWHLSKFGTATFSDGSRRSEVRGRSSRVPEKGLVRLRQITSAQAGPGGDDKLPCPQNLGAPKGAPIVLGSSASGCCLPESCWRLELRRIPRRLTCLPCPDEPSAHFLERGFLVSSNPDCHFSHFRRSHRRKAGKVRPPVGG
jgi:hypothetical protein